MSNEERLSWDGLPVRLLHEIQLWVIEALSRIDRPLSASVLTKMFDGEDLSLAKVSYHVSRLRDLGVLEPAGTRQARGAVERFYRIAAEDKA